MLLGIFDRLGAAAPESFAHIHGLIEATKRALAIRDAVCTDYDALKHLPEDFLTPAALRREADAISPTRAANLPIRPAHGDTVWMGAIDASGLAVSFIQSVFWEYGSGCVLPATACCCKTAAPPSRSIRQRSTRCSQAGARRTR